MIFYIFDFIFIFCAKQYTAHFRWLPSLQQRDAFLRHASPPHAYDTAAAIFFHMTRYFLDCFTPHIAPPRAYD